MPTNAFGNQGFQINPSDLKSNVRILQEVTIWEVVPFFVAPLCFIRSKVSAAIYQEILKQFLVLFVKKLYGDADFFHYHYYPVVNDHVVT